MRFGNFQARKVEIEAFKLQQGEVSNVIEDEDGYYIVKARKILPPTSIPFEQAQVAIESKLKQKQMQELEQDYFRQLQSSATILVPKNIVAQVTELAIKQYR